MPVVIAATQSDLQPSSAVLLKSRAVDDLVIAGYASVELVDKQGDLITTGALNKAFQKYMDNSKCRNVQLAHSNIQVGEVVPQHTDTSGRVWKSEVDDTGLFVVIQLRSDIEKAREVAAEIRKGNLKSFSIGGQAFRRVNKSTGERGSYREIQDMELHEVTICEKGINTESTFRILKEDKNMTEEEQVVTQLHSVLERLSKRLDDSEGTENVDKGKPPWLDDDKKDDDKDDKKDDKKDDDDTKKSEYVDEISLDYLNWMEDTLKGAGLDTGAIRNHFSKGYAPGEDGASHRGQPPLGIVGEGISAPKASFGSGKPKGNKFAIKASQDNWEPSRDGNFVVKENVSSSQLEQAYEVYKAAALEQQFKGELNDVFAQRLHGELTQKAEIEAANSFDSRGPVDRLEKAVLELAERIDGVTNENGEIIQKSANAPQQINIPSTEDLANISWDEVHGLASKALQGRGE